MRKWRGSMQPLEKGRPPYLLRWLSGWEDAGRSQRRVPGLLMSVSAGSVVCGTLIPGRLPEIPGIMNCSILTYGSKPEGGAWQIAVTDPLDPSESVGVLTLDGGHCVSTSGDYERYVEVDGVRYHHILDPRTGSPAHSDVAGVTIVTKDGFLSDALSTACFVLGQEEGQQLLEKYDAEGLFIDHEGTITMTEGMRQYFHLSNSQK